MTDPTHAEVQQWLTQQGAPGQWADFLTGLPWQVITAGVKIARASKTHPALALAAAAAYSGDQHIRDTIRAHLARGDPHPQPAGPNRAQRRTTAKGRRPAR